MLQKIKNTILTLCIGTLLYFYCFLTFYKLPNIINNKNTEEEVQELVVVEMPLVLPPEETSEPKQEPEQSTTVTTVKAVTPKTNQWITATVTAYCACMECCGKTNGITASGTQATAGRTIAMSKNYKFGTKIEIEGYGTFVVEDRGGAIQGNRIDMFFNTHAEALKFGKKSLRFRIVE